MSELSPHYLEILDHLVNTSSLSLRHLVSKLSLRASFGAIFYLVQGRIMKEAKTVNFKNAL